ncbi:MAG: carbamoyltransferase [Chitinophagales bacterium]
MKILGISAFYHDSAAAILIDGELVAAAQEERFTRKKHDASFPSNAVKFCLEKTGLSLEDLDAIAFYDKPFLKFERILETYYQVAPRGWQSFITAMPVWMKEKLFLKRIIREALQEIGSFDKKKLPLLFPEHHLSHAASAFFSSPYSESAILTIDGVGEWATAAILKGSDNQITVLKELHFPNSVGLLYSAFTYYLGFKVNSGEYKLMGLAPYGNQQQAEKLATLIKEKLVTIQPDGSISLDQKYFNYTDGLRMTNNAKWAQLFGFGRREEESELLPYHCDLALAIQNVTEEIVLKMALTAKALTGSRNLCMAGGVALNCVANGRLLMEKIFENIFVQPAAGDAGGAIGAAQAAHFIAFQKERPTTNADAMKGSFLGPEFSEEETLRQLQLFQAVSEKVSDADLLERTASCLASGKIVGWFQGRMEFGPRALGNRSILADPRSAAMQQKVNLQIKQREGFRPFAPAVVEEEASLYFNIKEPSPYMLFTASVANHLQFELPENYALLPLMERLKTPRSSLQAVTHVDFSARIQTVSKSTQPRFHALLKAFQNLTQIPVLLNTSFNVRGEPPVCTPRDAYTCFMRTGMDVLVIGNLIFEKEQQPQWKEDLPINFNLD